MKLGAMVSLRDFRALSVDADFHELLLFDGDLGRVKAGILPQLRSASPGIEFVHAQEFVEHDRKEHLLDLASENPILRELSINTVNDTRILAESLGSSLIVIHPGGIRASSSDPEALMRNLEDSLDRLGPERLLLENMPWYYWEKGKGRMVSSICVSLDDVLRAAELTAGLVLDTAHGYLSTREGNQRFLDDFVGSAGDKLKHIHVSDAHAPDSEGLQIGDGDIDFSFLAESHVPMMVEIWNGHEDGGSGFREGIRRLRAMEREW